MGGQVSLQIDSNSNEKKMKREKRNETKEIKGNIKDITNRQQNGNGEKGRGSTCGKKRSSAHPPRGLRFQQEALGSEKGAIRTNLLLPIPDDSEISS